MSVRFGDNPDSVINLPKQKPEVEEILNSRKPVELDPHKFNIREGGATVRHPDAALLSQAKSMVTIWTKNFDKKAPIPTKTAVLAISSKIFGLPKAVSTTSTTILESIEGLVMALGTKSDPSFTNDTKLRAARRTIVNVLHCVITMIEETQPEKLHKLQNPWTCHWLTKWDDDYDFERSESDWVQAHAGPRFDKPNASKRQKKT